jgi:hypothetical protein
MKILFDQGTPVGIRDALRAHTVRTAYEEGWSTLSNGDLLRVAEESDYDVLLTADTNLPHQQSLEGRRLAVVVLSRNRWLQIQSELGRIAEAIHAAEPGTYSFVEIPAR